MECHLTFLYYIHHEPGTLVPDHRHDGYELVYYAEGSGTLTIGEDGYPYAKNTFSITLPQQAHREEHAEGTDVLFIGFLYTGNPALLQNGVYEDPDGRVLRLIEEMQQELVSRKPFCAEKLNLLTAQAVIEQARLAGRGERELPDGLPYIEKFITENLGQTIDLRTLAQLSGYSYDHFRHLFKKETGLSPMTYIITRRIESAKQLLATTDRKISSIAYGCGFTSEAFFCSLFKRYTGVTPGVYRRGNSSAFTDH